MKNFLLSNSIRLIVFAPPIVLLLGLTISLVIFLRTPKDNAELRRKRKKPVIAFTVLTILLALAWFLLILGYFMGWIRS